MIDVAEAAMTFGGLAAVGVGLWWIEPAYSLIGVGGLLFSVTLFVRVKRLGAGREQDD